MLNLLEFLPPGRGERQQSFAESALSSAGMLGGNDEKSEYQT
jgi:hypothetical protein